MSYTQLVVTAILGTLFWDLFVVRTRLVLRRAFWVTYAILFCFQLLMNGVLTGTRMVRYNPTAIIGLRVAYAPVEDLGFGFALILLTLSCWVALGRRQSARARTDRRSSSPLSSGLQPPDLQPADLRPVDLQPVDLPSADRSATDLSATDPLDRDQPTG